MPQLRPDAPKKLLALALLLGTNLALSAAGQAINNDSFKQQIHQVAETNLEKHHVPGIAIALIRQGEIVWVQGVGHADAAKTKPVTGDTVFNVGSISKTVAAWGFLQLVESGQVDLDAPIQDYVARWRLPDSPFDPKQVTLRRLLSHNAGLSLHGYPGFDDANKLPTLEASLSGDTNGAGDVHLQHAPGTQRSYSGGGYTLAQLMLEEQTGKRFSEHMTHSVLSRLNMTSSNFGWTQAPNAATPHDKHGQPTAPVRFTALAAAGLETSCKDLAKFAVASMPRFSEASIKVLKPETIEQMQQQIIGDENRSSGMGYQQMKFGPLAVIGHLGSNHGWEAAMFLRPGTGDGLIMLTNGSNGAQVQRPLLMAWARNLLTKT